MDGWMEVVSTVGSPAGGRGYGRTDGTGPPPCLACLRWAEELAKPGSGKTEAVGFLFLALAREGRRQGVCERGESWAEGAGAYGCNPY